VRSAHEAGLAGLELEPETVLCDGRGEVWFIGLALDPAPWRREACCASGIREDLQRLGRVVEA